MTRRIWTWMAAAGALSLAACGSSSSSSGGGGAPAPGQCTPPAKATVFFKQDVYPVFTAQCATCHGDNQTSRPKFASIDPEVSYSAARTEVDPSNAASSALVVLPTGHSGHPDAMSDVQAATITRWIQECAQDNTRDTTGTTTATH